MKNISIWKDIKRLDKYPSLDEDKEVDVLIIGGGITGISTLYHLKDSGLNVMLVEQNEIGMSTTGNSTGKLSYLQNDLIDKIRINFDDEIASLYLNAQKDTIKEMVNIVNVKKIKCNLKKVNSGLYTNKKEEIESLKNLESFLKRNGIKSLKGSTNLVENKYMIEVKDTYIFHPLKFIHGLLGDNFQIYENACIKKIENDDEYYLSYTDSYKIKSKWVVIASHYPYFSIPYFFPIKGGLEKSYLSASKYKIKPISLISYAKPCISIRNYNDYLIYLSNSHFIDSKINDKKHFLELLKKVKVLNLKPSYLWSNIDIITNDGLPYIGKIKDRLLIGTGYNTWGLTNGFLAGNILSDIILGKKNRYVKLFDPKRKNLIQISGSLASAFKSLKGIANGYLNNPSKEVHICPHLGCRLVYNEVENTWDCPCHGSRFNENGKCINSPANENIKIK